MQSLFRTLLICMAAALSLLGCSLDSQLKKLAGDSQALSAEMRISDVTITEGTSPVFLVMLSSALRSQASFEWEILAGNQSPTADFTALSGSVTISAGQESYAITVPLVDDILFEGTEDFRLKIVPTSGNLVASQSSIVITVQDNDSANAPVLTQACATTVNQGVAYSCSPSATDADGNTVSWSLGTGNTCAWASIQSSTGAVSGTPNDNQVGSCTLVFKASDGTQDSNIASIAITVNNIAPTLTIADTSISEDAPSAVIRNDAAVQASDEGYGVYSLDNASTTAPKCSDNGTLSIHATNGAVTFQPTANYNGTCNVKVVFDDQNSSSNTVTDEFAVTVNSVNDTPVITQSCATSLNEDAAYSCSPTVTDAETGDTQTWSLDGANTCLWAAINPATGAITGTPNDDEVGTCSLRFKTNDGTTNSATAIVAVTVNNVAPTLTIANPAAISEDAGATVLRTDAQVQASDEGYGTYSLDTTTGTTPRCSSNGSVAVSATNGQITYTPTANYNGTCYIKVVFDDGNASSNTVSSEITVTVNSSNDTPTITQSCATSLNEDVAYSCSPTVTDADTGDTQTWSLDGTNACAWASITAATGAISGTPTDDQVGTCALKFKVNDGTTDSAVTTVNVTVNNVAPTLTISNPGQIWEDSGTNTIRTNAQVQASDEGYGTYSIDTTTGTTPRCASNGTVSIDGTNGEITYAPSANYNGTCYVKVIFDDGNASTNTVAAEITVVVAPNPTLALSDGTTSSTSYVRQQATAVAIGSDSGVAKWCVSQTQTTRPASGSATCNGGSGGSSGWYTSRPSSFSVSVGAGAKTVYLWVADSADVVNADTVSDAITLDTTLPATPSVSLSDPGTSSTTSTDRATVTLSITSDTDAVKWCVFEQASATAAPSAPLFDNACWVSSRPTTQLLGSDAGRTVYIYTKDIAENVSAAAATASITKTTVAKLAVLGERLIGTGDCRPFRVVTEDASDLPSQVTSGLAVTVSKTGNAVLYSDASCATGSSSLSFTVGAWAGTFYMKNATAETVTLSASASGLTGGSLSTKVVATTTGVRDLASGELFSCFVLDTGTVKCSGKGNTGGQLGDGNWQDSLSPIAPTGITTAKAVAAGTDHACVILGDNSIKCWGGGWAGQLGDGNYGSPTPVSVTGITNAASISLGFYYSCAVLTDKTVKCWGSNSNGQLGDGTTTDRLVPVAVPGLNDIVEIAAGSEHTCALHENGSVSCWGSNWEGELGNGTTTNSLTPKKIPTLSNVVSISANANSCALLADGSAKCWGASWVGQNGDGTTTSRTSPVSVSSLSTAVSIAAHGRFTCSGLIDGTAKCWGDNDMSELGDGTRVMRTTPVSVSGLSSLVQLSEGHGPYHICGRLEDGTARCWGQAAYGMGGDNVNRHAFTPTTISGLTTASAVSSGTFHSCSLLSGGTVKCWGWNSVGQLGDQSWATTSSAVSVLSLTGATQVEAGEAHSCAITGGSIQCWGRGNEGQLGNGMDTSSASPVTVTGITTATEIATERHTNCVRLSDATLRCWGGNNYGQLGNGTTTSSSSPVDPGLTGVAGVSVGFYHTCANLNDGTVRCWGRNGDGQLGNSGAGAQSTTPVTVTGLSNVSALASGMWHTCALITDGSVKCWGGGWNGNLGDGNWTNSTSPVTVANLSNATQVSASVETTCAVLNDGTVKCWGAGYAGKAGQGDTNSQGSAIQVLSLANVSQVSVGAEHACARLTDSTVKCWGSNGYSQSGGTPHVTSPITPLLP